MYGMRAQDEAPSTHFRSDRLCRINGQLYFSTRENTLEGPFEDRETATREIQAYVARMRALAASPASRTGDTASDGNALA